MLPRERGWQPICPIPIPNPNILTKYVQLMNVRSLRMEIYFYPLDTFWLVVKLYVSFVESCCYPLLYFAIHFVLLYFIGFTLLQNFTRPVL